MTAVDTYPFLPEERPLFPGSPYTPPHSTRRRIGYAAVGVLAGLGSTFPNALVTVNVPSLAGELGAYATQLSWLPAIYVAFNATANLSLVKARAQFGIPQVVNALLIAYLMAGVLQLAWPTFASAVLIRAVNGVTAAALTTLGIYYLLQVVPAKLRPLALVGGIGLTQLGPALARTVPVDLLASDHWRGLHWIEVGVALTLIAVTTLAPLPPSDRSKQFELLDGLTIGLAIAAALLMCGVLAEGRLLWWTDTAWLGWALAASIPLALAAFQIEWHRSRPLLQTRWIGTRDVVRFAAVAMLIRVALAEQTYNSVGLLTSGGLTNDQLQVLFAIVAGSMVLGTVVAALTLSEQGLLFQILTAALIIALAAWLDSGATNVTRPPQLYLSQALIGFGTTLFIGPSLVQGFLQMMSRGPDHFVTFIVLFSTSQNVGGLAGSALLGSYQTVAAHAHATALSEHLIGADPQVAARIAGGASSLGGAVVDPFLRGAEGAGLLGQALTREANILAFNDTFLFVTALSLMTAAYVAYLIVVRRIRQQRTTRAGVAA